MPDSTFKVTSKFGKTTRSAFVLSCKSLSTRNALSKERPECVKKPDPGQSAP